MKLTEAEWQVMNAIWMGHPATARDVAERLPPRTSWAYTTIKTMLSRLVGKGALAERKRANTSLYEPRLTRRQARFAAVRSIVDSAFEGAFGALVHFLVDEEDLSPPDRGRLANMLEEDRRKRGRP